MVSVNGRRAAALGGALVLVLVSGLFGVSYVLSAFLPSSFAVPEAVRVAGGAALVGGLGLAGWTFRHRDPRNVAASTYYTLVKAMGRARLAEMRGRKEELSVDGPHRYVRNPLYLAVVSIIFGWGLITSSTLFLVAAVVFLLWFSLVLIPFEERELAALFGEQWARYSEATPMLIPLVIRKHPRSGNQSEPAKR